MEFKDIVEVITAGTAAACNDLLSKGWTLLTVVSGNNGPVFVLGRDSATGPLAGKKTSSEQLRDAGL